MVISLLIEDGVEHLLVGCSFLVERQRIGTGGGGHAPKTDDSVGEGGFDIFANFGCRGVKHLRKSISGFASGAADVMALRDLIEDCGYVRLFDNLQMFICSVALQASDGLCGVKYSDALISAE